MNNGFNGTGTAFILYILLAFCMPIVYLYRLAKRRHDFGRQFVFGHFLLGLTVTVLAVLCIGYLWRLLAISKDGTLHQGLLLMAYFAVVTIMLWILIPRIVRMAYRLSHKKAMLYYKNPLIQPWFAEPYYHHVIRRTRQHKFIRALFLRRSRSTPGGDSGQPLYFDL